MDAIGITDSLNALLNLRRVFLQQIVALEVQREEVALIHNTHQIGIFAR